LNLKRYCICSGALGDEHIERNGLDQVGVGTMHYFKQHHPFQFRMEIRVYDRGNGKRENCRYKCNNFICINYTVGGGDTKDGFSII